MNQGEERQNTDRFIEELKSAGWARHYSGVSVFEDPYTGNFIMIYRVKYVHSSKKFTKEEVECMAARLDQSSDAVML